MSRFVPLFLGSALCVSPCGCHGQSIAADDRAPPARMDAGFAPPMPVLPGSAPAGTELLRVDIEIAGMPVTSRRLACGQCVDMSVGVSGGRPPYSYSWSGAELSGSGPHHVWPRGPVD